MNISVDLLISPCVKSQTTNEDGTYTNSFDKGVENRRKENNKAHGSYLFNDIDNFPNVLIK